MDNWFSLVCAFTDCTVLFRFDAFRFSQLLCVQIQLNFTVGYGFIDIDISWSKMLGEFSFHLGRWVLPPRLLSKFIVVFKKLSGYLYRATNRESLASGHSDMDHTVLPANDTISAFNYVSMP